MTHESDIGAALRALRQRGFTPLPRRRGVRSFEGVIACKSGDIRVRISIEDWDFQRYPVIRVLEPLANTPTLLPHVSADGQFCYFTPGAVILDRYRPDHALLQCLDRARDELDRLISDPAYRQAEFTREFGANWSIGQNPPSYPILLGDLDTSARKAGAYWIGPEENSCVIVAATEAEALALSQSRGWPPPRRMPATCWIVHSSCAPILTPDGLPRTMKAWFRWIRAWDQAAYATVQTLLGQKGYMAQPLVLFLFRSVAGWFGVEFRLDDTKRRGFARNPSALRQLFHMQASDHPILRLSVNEVGADYVHSRNLHFPTLKDRRVVVIGCGSIGGYLAQAMVKLGAGRGRGELVLIDPDVLRADNLGRHFLGFESLYEPKATALQTALTNQFPGAQITALDRATRPSVDLAGDLVINASGEEALSNALNHARLQQDEASRAPLLHVWICGNGECTQALWTDTGKHACFRCLRTADRSLRFDPKLPIPETRVVGCQAFTPYAVSAPMAAAALATDLVIAWLQGDPSPRFRTRMLEGTSMRQLKNQNASPLEKCPACSIH